MAKVNGRNDSMTRTVTCTKAPTKTIRKMEWACLSGSLETIIRAATRMTSATVTVKCTGRTDHAIRANGTKEFKTASVAWSSRMVESKKVSSRITLSRDLRWPRLS